MNHDELKSKLGKKRDELAEKWCSKHGLKIESFAYSAYRDSFDAAVEILLPMVENMKAALEFYAVHGLAKVKLGDRMDERLAQEFYVNGGLARACLAKLEENK